jgi:Na+-translocating ferredoxin:NAD+ oxidoreductase RnfE subunit
VKLSKAWVIVMSMFYGSLFARFTIDAGSGLPVFLIALKYLFSLLRLVMTTFTYSMFRGFNGRVIKVYWVSFTPSTQALH